MAAHVSFSKQHCCVPFCTSNKGKNPETTFHIFPKDLKVKKQWIINIRRDEGPNFKIVKSTVVCSNHFTKDDFKYSPVRKTLKKGTVPTVFSWTRAIVPRTGAATKRKFKEHNLTDGEFDGPVAGCKTEVETLREEQRKYNEVMEKKNQCINNLQEKLALYKFGAERFGNDDNLIKLYTGFATYNSFKIFFECIEPTASNMRSAYYTNAESTSLAGRPKCMMLIDELFMFLARIRLNLCERDLSVRCDCSMSTVSRKLITWVNYLYFLLGSIPIWLTKDQVQRYMPVAFKQKYGNTRVIIDCTEIKTQTPTSLLSNSMLYSNYKSHTTFKGLVGIAPHGCVTFISPLYTGNMSDVEITKKCGLIDLIEVGDSVMADKGFLVKDVLNKKGAHLNLPPFLKSGVFTPEECAQTEEIATLRIHVERYISRVKDFQIFKSTIPLSLLGSINQLWAVSCILANFRGPLIRNS